MCDKFGVDDKTRFLVLYLDIQLRIQEISKIIKRSEWTLRRWESRLKKGEDPRVPKKGRGCKKKITEEMENRVAEMVKENPEGASLKKIAARTGLCIRSVAVILANKGFKYQRFDETVLYKEEEKMVRMEFCRKMLSDDGKLIYRTFFSDEMGIQLNEAHKTRVWQLPNEKIRKKTAAEYVKLDCWGAISAQGATSLDIYKGGMSGDRYRKVVKRHKAEMEALYPDGEFYFLQDSHSAHRMNEEWIIKQSKLNLVKLPRRSPDLNIIENIWIALKKRVKSESPANEKELRESMLKHWEELTRVEVLQSYLEGLHGKYMHCLERNGDKAD